MSPRNPQFCNQIYSIYSKQTATSSGINLDFDETDVMKLIQCQIESGEKSNTNFLSLQPPSTAPQCEGKFPATELENHLPSCNTEY